MTKRYAVHNLRCAGCAARIEDAIAGLPGVKSAAINLDSARLRVEGEQPELAAMIRLADSIEPGTRFSELDEDEGIPETDTPPPSLLVSDYRLWIAAVLFEPFPEISLSLPGWAGLAYLVFGLTLFAFWAQNTAQRHCDDTHAGILLSLEGPFGYVLSVAGGREPMNVQVLAGGIVILAGVFLSVWSESKRRRNL